MNRHVMIHIFMFIIAMSPIVAKKNVIHIHRIKPITAPIIMVEMPKISFMPNIQNINQKKNEPTPQNMSIGRTYSSNKTHKYIAA